MCTQPHSRPTINNMLDCGTLSLLWFAITTPGKRKERVVIKHLVCISIFTLVSIKWLHSNFGVSLSKYRINCCNIWINMVLCVTRPFIDYPPKLRPGAYNNSIAMAVVANINGRSLLLPNPRYGQVQQHPDPIKVWSWVTNCRTGSFQRLFKDVSSVHQLWFAAELGQNSRTVQSP